MRRREFIAGLGGAAAWPLLGRAQQRSDLTVGMLGGGGPEGADRYLSGFAQGLAETGYVEGKNIAIEYRWARGEYDLLRKMADDLVSRQVTVITAYGTNAALAAKAATTTIPMVFGNGGYPIWRQRHRCERAGSSAHRQATGAAARGRSAGACHCHVG